MIRMLGWSIWRNIILYLFNLMAFLRSCLPQTNISYIFSLTATPTICDSKKGWTPKSRFVKYPSSYYWGQWALIAVVSLSYLDVSKQ